MKKTFNKYQEITADEVQIAIGHAIGQTRCALDTLGAKFKAPNSTDNRYPATDNEDWTEGFYTGELWLAYELTNDPYFKDIALSQLPSYRERLEKRIFVDHHDMGFLYSLSCVAAYKVAGSEAGRDTALMAADNLISRFQKTGGFIQAWGELGAEEDYRFIIDCLLNLPLLYWASDVSGKTIYADCAKIHITTALKNIIRSDNSTFHTFFMNPKTGEPQYGVTHQGYRDGSAWARGQAWGIYGTALSFRYTKNPEYIPLFKKITNFFIDHLPEDLVPYWDFDFTDGTTEPKDSSAAAIAVCGMLEMSRYMEHEDRIYYTDMAGKILKALADHYAVKDPALSNGQLLRGTYAKSSEYNTCPNLGVDECNTWGDYFYLEALMREARPDWNLYW